jgi:hypothetical protein
MRRARSDWSFALLRGSVIEPSPERSSGSTWRHLRAIQKIRWWCRRAVLESASRSSVLRKAEINGTEAGIGPMCRHYLHLGVETDAIGAVHVRVTK